MNEKIEKTDDVIPFYPDHLKTEIRVMWRVIIIVLVIGVLGLVNPIGLGTPADPLDTPERLRLDPEELT